MDQSKHQIQCSLLNNSGINTGEPNAANTAQSATVQTAVDWYNSQTLDLDNASIFWKSLAPKPTTSVYVSDRGGEGDGIHVAVVDDFGVVTGIKGNVIEKHLSLSKAVDAVSSVNSPQKIYYKNYIADFSDNVYAGFNPSNSLDTYHLRHTISNWIWNCICSIHNCSRIMGFKCTGYYILCYR